MDLIVVVTCPKLRDRYLLSTLRQLDHGGAASIQKIVMCDGPMTVECPWPWISKEDGPSGTAPMMLWVFKQAQHLGASRILYCEDDLKLANGDAPVTRMLGVQVPDHIALVHGFDQAQFKKGRMPAPGLHPLPAMGRNGHGIFGTLFVLIPRRTIDWVVQDDSKEWRGRMQACDRLLGSVLARSPTPEVWMRVPGDVDHAGDKSTGGPKRIRRATHWIGRGLRL